MIAKNEKCSMWLRFLFNSICWNTFPDTYLTKTLPVGQQTSYFGRSIDVDDLFTLMCNETGCTAINYPHQYFVIPLLSS